MKVAILVESCVWGGLEAHTVDLARTLVADGHTVVVACIGEETTALYRRVTGTTLALATIEPPEVGRRHSPFRWRTALVPIAADALIFQKGTLHTGSLAMDLALRLTHGAFVAVQHLEPPPLCAWRQRLGPWWYRQRIAGYARSLCPGVTVCVSDSVADGLASQYGFRRDRLVTIRNGVDTDRFRPDPERRARARAHWQVGPDGVVFGTVRRLVVEKGVDVAIEAFASAVTSLPDRSLWLVIAGEGPEQTSLEALAARLGVRDCVRFLGFCREPWEIYPGLDVFLLPSRIEALGAVAAEAMASGCEVIASKVGGIPEIVSNDGLGTLVTPGDPSALSAAMVAAVVRAPERTAEMVHRAREHALQHFDAVTQFRQIEALLQ